MAVDLKYYKRKLAGEAPPIVADEPQHGYYRRMNDAIVILPGDTLGGCDITKNGIKITDPYEASDLWVGCAKNAIEQEIYARWVETRRWPEQEAMIEKSGSLNKNLVELAKVSKKAMDSLKKRDASITDEMRAQQVTTIQSQLEADTAAGYVQQIRAMVGDAQDTIKIQIQPLKDQEAEIKRIWTDPFNVLEEAKDYMLSRLTEYGRKLKMQSNDPDFKFAAGKAGEGKTIALKKKDVLVVTDMAKLIKAYGKNEKVLDAFRKAIIAEATAAWKAEKKAPAGTQV